MGGFPVTPDSENISNDFTDQTSHQACVISYNSRGFNGMQQDFIKTLVDRQTVGDRIPILCNQENFILRGNSFKILQTLPDFHIFINPAIKTALDRGRPRGGMFIAVPSSIKSQVADVSPGHWRVQAINISSKSSCTLLINTYFPCDYRLAAGDLNETIEVLEIVKKLIESSGCNSVIMTGDINTDFRRNSGQVVLVTEALTELSLSKSWDMFQIDFTCAHGHTDNGEILTTSIIDHFFHSSELGNNILDAGVIHSPDNPSDHSPIYCTLSDLNVKLDTSHQISKPYKPSWKTSSLEQKDLYRIKLEENLSSIAIPSSVLHCKDLKCKNDEHCESVDNLAIKVLETVQATAESSLSYPGSRAGCSSTTRVVPGWSESVKPYRDNAYFWHQVWLSCGKPINNEVYRIMKRTRNLYHYQFRKIKKAEDTIKKNKLLDACLNDGGDLFKEIKGFRKTKQVVANSIDGVVEDIPGHFRNIYSELYNSVDDAENMGEIKDQIEAKISEFSLADVDKVTPKIVKEAVSKLNPNKTDPVFSFSSDCIRVESDKLAELLAVIIKCYLIHGHVTRFLLLATLVPIIKDKLGSINSSKNYRSIAISSLILKILDWIIILLFGNVLGLHDLQFAYQPGISGNMCTFAVLETVDYFLRHGSEVFMCTMDMTKAFDMTVHSKLFSKMFQAGLSAVFLRILIFIYSEQFANVRWNGEVSSVFTMHNGVRQGAVLSALVYCFYCEQLFNLLERKRSGCWVNGLYLGLLGYSDDNICLAPSLTALQDMLETCEEFATAHNLKFSTDTNPIKCKTKTMAFLKTERALPNLRLCGNPLPWTDKCKHLGTTITSKIDGCEEDMKIKNAMYVKKNLELNQEFYFAHPTTKLKINNIYNSHYSSSPLWNLFGHGAQKLESSYNRSIKIMLGLPLQTHRYLIEPLTGEVHIKKVLLSRYLGFIEKIMSSGKQAIKMLAETAKKDVRSVTGQNFRHIMLLLGKTSVEAVEKIDVKEIEYFPISKEDSWKVDVIKEIVEVKSTAIEIDNFEEEELDNILLYLCTS